MYFETLAKCVDFDGRSTRTEYFVFILGSALFGIPMVFIDVMTGMFSPYYGVGPITGLYMVLLFVPSLSLQIRRLHDADFSGWWLLIGLVPFIGFIAQLILPFFEGTEGPNKYGSDPRKADSKSAP